MTILSRLCDWYESHCNGSWEHEYGIKIETIDNPGWTVEIDLAGTELEGATLQKQLIEHSENNWHSVEIEDGKFRGACGPANLEAVISGFLRLLK